MIRPSSSSSSLSSSPTTMTNSTGTLALLPLQTPRRFSTRRSQPPSTTAPRLRLPSSEPDSFALWMPSPPRRARSSLLPGGNNINDLLTDTTNIPLLPSLDSPRLVVLKPRDARRSTTGILDININNNNNNNNNNDEANEEGGGDDSFDLELAALSLPHAIDLDGSRGHVPFLSWNPSAFARTNQLHSTPNLVHSTPNRVNTTPSPSLVQFGVVPAPAANLLSKQKNKTPVNDLLASPPSRLDRSVSDHGCFQSKENKKPRLHDTV